MRIPALFKKLNVIDWLGLYQPQIDEWKKRGLTFEKVTVSSDFADPIKHRIQLSIQSKDKNRLICGYGDDDYELFAYEKAICELAERESAIENFEYFRKYSSNGFAAHRFMRCAIEYAKNELIERDAFFRHWLTKTPFKIINNITRSKIIEFKKSIEDRNHKLILANTFLGAKPTVVAFIVNNATNGFVIGNSCNADSKAAMLKATKEAFYTLTTMKQVVVDWSTKDLSNHKDYWYLEGQLPNWFFKDCNVDRLPPRRIKPNFTIKRKDGIAKVAAAYSKDLIDLWVGPTPKKILTHIHALYGITPNEDFHPFP